MGDSGQKKNRKQSLELDPLFARFWSAYPRKVKKPEAARAFAKHSPDEDLLSRMLEAIAWQSKTDKWLKGTGEFIPHPGTWLNNREWEDLPTKPATPLEETPAQQRERNRKTQELICDPNIPNPLQEFLLNGAANRTGGTNLERPGIGPVR